MNNLVQLSARMVQEWCKIFSAKSSAQTPIYKGVCTCTCALALAVPYKAGFKVWLIEKSDAFLFFEDGRMIYDVPFIRIRTFAMLVSWARHLLEKRWMTRELMGDFLARGINRILTGVQ